MVKSKKSPLRVECSFSHGKCRIAMAKAAFNKKRTLFTSTLDLELRKKLVKFYIWSIATGCLTRYRTRHFFNNSNTNEDIATKFEQEYVRCVRNEEECVCSAPNCWGTKQRSAS